MPAGLTDDITRISRIIGALLVALLVLLQTACDAKRSNEVVELTLWAMGREGEVVQSLIPEFEREHPEVRVRVQQIPWSAAHEKLLTAFAGEALPDVMQVGNTWIPEFVAIGALRPLTAQERQDSDFFPGAMASVKVADIAYALPWYMDTRVLFYRTDILRAAGFTSPPETWSQWMQVMQAIKRRLGNDSYAILLPFDEWETPVIFARQLGSELLRDNNRHGAFQTPATKAALRFYLSMFEADFAPTQAQSQSGNVYHEFAQGRIAMYISGPWNIVEFSQRLPAELQAHWDTAPLPAPDVDGKPVSIAGGSSLAISSQSAHVSAARELIQYLLATEQQSTFYRLTGDLPARPSAWSRGQLDAKPHTAAFWKQLNNVFTPPAIPEWQRIAQRFARSIETVIRHEQSLDQSLEKLDRDVDAILEKRRWLTSGGAPQ